MKISKSGDENPLANFRFGAPTNYYRRIKRTVADARCPRCKLEEEDYTFGNWLTWVFSRGTNEQCRLFCCGLWIIWTSRNKFVYENRQTTSRDISHKISDFLFELRGIEEKKLNLAGDGVPRTVERCTRILVYFDAAFDQQNARSASGLIVRGEGGEILVSKSVIHTNIATPFAAEAHARFTNNGRFENDYQKVPKFRTRQIGHWSNHQRSFKEGRRTLPNWGDSKYHPTSSGEDES
ncbi:hypothetical protein GOBAR_DD26443 [Gossypium barbadense]|nr:hypothetical protein GOBAR_DD26443 [Gossypium barbadense]